jgi:hypothetical protein
MLQELLCVLHAGRTGCVELFGFGIYRLYFIVVDFAVSGVITCVDIRGSPHGLLLVFNLPRRCCRFLVPIRIAHGVGCGIEKLECSVHRVYHS